MKGLIFQNVGKTNFAFILKFQIYQGIKSNVLVTDRLCIVTKIAGKGKGVQIFYLLAVIEYYL